MFLCVRTISQRFNFYGLTTPNNARTTPPATDFLSARVNGPPPRAWHSKIIVAAGPLAVDARHSRVATLKRETIYAGAIISKFYYRVEVGGRG